MSKNCVSVIIVALLFFNLITTNGFSQDGTQSIRLMFYNVENLFDIYDDTLTDDNEFLPGGIRKWNFTRYNKKLNSLYKTIIAAGEWNPPAVVALCEVENKKVLEDLIYGTYLSKFNYRIIHEESPDHRGIDVCMIYERDCVDIIEYKYWIPAEIKNEDFTSRSILYVKFRIGADTLQLIVNHWPSRRGGALAAEYLRRKVAEMVKIKIDSIIASTKTRERIILMGDFNCSPDDQVMRILVRNESSYSLVNLSENLADNGLGTYRYQGIWEMIDQVIVSGDLLKLKKGLYTNVNLFTVFKPDFLLSKDPKYPGFTPFSTYRGYKYQGGYSDHLPVLLDLKVR
ncbi:MAG TPA: endonuclease/exonuclease/phosphatase family protein [Bacteroidales bacterium]|nr:endonuclease/exonuclease/phosphatase family protein [Bacteroidales bacterium]